MVETLVDGDIAGGGGSEEGAFEVEAEVLGVEGLVRGVVWRGGVGGVDGGHPGEGGGVVGEVGEVFFVEVFEEGGGGGVEVWGVGGAREVHGAVIGEFGCFCASGFAST